MSLKNPVTPPGIDPGTVRLVAQLLNHYVTLCPKHTVGAEDKMIPKVRSVGTISSVKVIAQRYPKKSRNHKPDLMIFWAKIKFRNAILLCLGSKI